MCKCHKEPSERYVRAVDRLTEVCGYVNEWGGDMALEPDFRHRYHFPSLDRLSVQRIDELRRELFAVLAVLAPGTIDGWAEEQEAMRIQTATKLPRRKR